MKRRVEKAFKKSKMRVKVVEKIRRMAKKSYKEVTLTNGNIVEGRIASHATLGYASIVDREDLFMRYGAKIAGGQSRRCTEVKLAEAYMSG